MTVKKKAGRQGRKNNNRTPRTEGFRKLRKVFSILVLFSLLMFSLGAAGYVIFFRTVSS